MHNVYDVLFTKPALEKWEMSPQLEALAQSLVDSGRFRIDANEKCNFVRFSSPFEGINIVLSYRELCDPNLLPRTEEIITQLLSYRRKGKNLQSRVQKEIERLRHDVTKIVGVDEHTEMMLARALVQAIDPCVMLLLLAEGTELFISYSHTVGDMLDIRSWQEVGSSSGLQSTGFRESAVFVSSGGDPFRPEDKKEYESDGEYALCRMIVIAGQELGHYADIIRDKRGRKISRHSADIYGTESKPRVSAARMHDIKRMHYIDYKLQGFGLLKLCELEKFAKFYKKQKRRGLIAMNNNRKIRNLTRKFLRKCRRSDLKFVATIHPDKDGHIGTPIRTMVLDMAFNLEPKADAYSREDPVEEEAIATIEALARVPQQVNKWGHLITSRTMSDLYKVFYREVIPACIEAYENASGEKYHFHQTKKGLIRKSFEKLFSKK